MAVRSLSPGALRVLFISVLLVLAAGAFAAPTLPPLKPLTPAVGDDCIPFDYSKAEVKQIDGRWKVVVGDMWLLDFDKKEMEARQALLVIKFYHLNSQCFIGRPNAPMQYFLADGKAPNEPMPGEDSIGFNPDKLEVKRIFGSWKVVEGNHYLLDFAAKKDQAEQALATIKKFGFTRVCYVGRPNAPMMYFRSGDAEYKEDKIAFDYNKAEVKQFNGRWKVVVGNMALLDFNTSEANARQALKVIQYYKLNEQCFLGRPNPPMEYYLSNGKAPAGQMTGEDVLKHDLNKLEMKFVGGEWKLTQQIPQGTEYILGFGNNEHQAWTALALIYKYGFPNIGYVARPNPSMTYFRK